MEAPITIGRHRLHHGDCLDVLRAMTIEEATAKTEPGALAGQQGLF